ncbi:hypothetical protein Ciccas_005250 [Cichlidogyrus casuarinus]|uniref:Uncharacterized protein n=1 Tax=Cichlidogyrus casuarinus TaxID=1844966 RepID=A0ABD2Q9G0_9PLAT
MSDPVLTPSSPIESGMFSFSSTHLAGLKHNRVDIKLHTDSRFRPLISSPCSSPTTPFFDKKRARINMLGVHKTSNEYISAKALAEKMATKEGAMHTILLDVRPLNQQTKARIINSIGVPCETRYNARRNSNLLDHYLNDEHEHEVVICTDKTPIKEADPINMFADVFYVGVDAIKISHAFHYYVLNFARGIITLALNAASMIPRGLASAIKVVSEHKEAIKLG